MLGGIMTYKLGTNQLALLNIAFNDAQSSKDSAPAGTQGLYARVYELLFAMISEDGSGQQIISEADAATIDWQTWKVSGTTGAGVG
jgi:hypothetical protein